MFKSKKCVSQKTIRQEWIPFLLRLFQDSVPPIDVKYPKVYIATDVTLPKIKQEIEAKSGVKFDFTKDFYKEATVEYIEGAIVIYMENIPEDRTEEKFFIDFARAFLDTLGQFYTGCFEAREWRQAYLLDDTAWLHLCLETNLDVENLIIHNCLRLGYRVWHAFSVSAITNPSFRKVVGKDSLTEDSSTKVNKVNGDNNDNGDWLRDYLEDIFAEDKVDEFKIGTYFAHLFAYNFEDSLADLPDYICNPMCEVEELLRRQFSKESFWVVDEDFLYDVGKIVLEIKTNDVIEYMKVSDALGGEDDEDDEDYEEYDYDGEDSDYEDEYVDNLTAQPAPDKKKKKAKRKAQKQARKKNRKK